MVLVAKSHGNPRHCVLDTAKKLLERIILSRLTVYTETPDDSGYYENLFGFQQGRLMLDAIRSVPKIAKTVFQNKRRKIPYRTVVKLDVRYSFNSVSWVAIGNALHNPEVSESLLLNLKSCFKNRVLLYDTYEEEVGFNITARNLQGQYWARYY